MLLPEKKPITKKRTRFVRATLSADLYLKLELEAYERGITPYKLASILLINHIESQEWS